MSWKHTSSFSCHLPSSWSWFAHARKIPRKNLNTKENHHWLELLLLALFWKIRRIEKVSKLKASTRHGKLMQRDILSWVLKHIKDKSGITDCEKTDEQQSGVKRITSIFIYLYTPCIYRDDLIYYWDSWLNLSIKVEVLTF